MKKLFLLLVILGLGAGAYWYFVWNQPCQRLTRSICSDGESRLCNNIKALVRENLTQDQCQQFLDGTKKVEELLQDTSQIKKALKSILED